MRLSRGIVAVLLLTLSARTVAAQITTFVPPKPAPRPDTTQKTVAAKAAEKRDSVSRLTLTSMKAWVDSAVGLPAPSPVPARDTATTDSGRVDSLFRNDVLPPAPTRFFSNGAIAPATASNLPTIVAAGVVSVFVGLLLLRPGRRRPPRGSS
jgi:hypothetical protein